MHFVRHIGQYKEIFIFKLLYASHFIDKPSFPSIHYSKLYGRVYPVHSFWTHVSWHKFQQRERDSSYCLPERLFQATHLLHPPQSACCAMYFLLSIHPKSCKVPSVAETMLSSHLLVLWSTQLGHISRHPLRQGRAEFWLMAAGLYTSSFEGYLCSP